MIVNSYRKRFFGLFLSYNILVQYILNLMGFRYILQMCCCIGQFFFNNFITKLNTFITNIYSWPGH